jgi:hypothetical protein
VDVSTGALGFADHEHDRIEGVFGEQLLAPDDNGDKADRVDEI